MSDAIRTGDAAPAFSLPSTAGNVSLAGLLSGGRRLVLAFYVEDGTPSCESEIAMLRDCYDTLRESNAAVLAVSADDLNTHRAFAARLGGLPFALASDTSLECARTYGVVNEDDPRRSRRALFVIDGDGRVLLAFPHFQPANISQVEAIFQTLGATV